MILPLWQFGKARAVDGAQRGSYAVLASAPEFSDELQGILRRITENTSWRPRDGSARASVLACWPLGGDDWLLLRFIDDGIDDHHRPNTMRIEAALAKSMPWERIRELLTLEAWPAPASDGAVSIALAPHPRIDEMPPRPSAPILCAGADELISTLFEMRSNAKRQEKQNRSNVHGNSTSQPPYPKPTISIENNRRKFSWKYLAAILVIILCGAMVILLMQYDEIKQLSGSNNELTRKNESLFSERRNLEERVDELTSSISDRDGEISLLEEENQNLQKSVLDILPENLRTQYEAVMESLQQTQIRLETLIQNLSDTEGDMNVFKANLRKAVEDAVKQEEKQEQLSHGNPLPGTPAPTE